MTPALPGVFISYERAVSASHAGRLYDRLSDRIGEGRVFMDVDSIRLGVDFVESLHSALSSCEVLLAVIGPGWVERRDAGGQRALDDDNDFVRLEIQTALDRGIPVVPVLINEAEIPHEDELPGSLQPLSRRQGVRLRDDTFRLDSSRLIDQVQQLVDDHSEVQTVYQGDVELVPPSTGAPPDERDRGDDAAASMQRSEQKAALDSARSLEWGGQLSEAEAAYQRLAEDGYLDATFALHLGLRNREDAYDQALHWLQIAAKQIDLIAPGSLPVAMSEALQNDPSLNLKARPWSEDDRDTHIENLADAYTDLGLTFVEAGRTADGERLIVQAAEMAYSPAEFQWGLILLARGEPLEAERWIERAAADGLDEAEEKLHEIRSQ